MTKNVLPRGIRNNNPLNIDRNNIKWDGMSKDQSGDNRFVVFDDAIYGIRAATKILRTYTRSKDKGGHGLKTINQVVNRWAPPVENDSSSYAEHVAKRIGVEIDDTVDFRNKPLMIRIISTMISHENGQQPYTIEEIGKAVDLAFA